MTLYKGTILGIKYGHECDTEKELIDWLVELIIAHNQHMVEVLKILMEQK